MKKNLKKFSVMLIMAILLVAGTCISAFAATVGEQLLQAESGWTRYEDTNKNISYV